jgi:hypothetical protein
VFIVAYERVMADVGMCCVRDNVSNALMDDWCVS